MEASDIMLRLLKGDVISSDDTYTTILREQISDRMRIGNVYKSAMKRDGLSEAPNSVECKNVIPLKK